MTKMPRRGRWFVLLVALVALVLPVACVGPEVVSGPQEAEETAAVEQTIMQGTADDSGAFSGVVLVTLPARVLPGGKVIAAGGCSGTLISADVVLTAAHCVFFDASRCASYAYQQPLTPQGPPIAGAQVHIPASAGPFASGDPYGEGALHIGVDAIAAHPGYLPDVPKTCCPVDPASCAAMCVSDLSDRMHDVALLHLERPVSPAVATPLPVLARLGKSFAPGEYPVDFASLPGKTVTIVGMSLSTAHPSQSWRTYGNAAVCDVDDVPGKEAGKFLNCADRNAKPQPPFVLQPGSSWHVFTISTGTTNPDPVPGDSGGPAVLNATSLGASTIAGVAAGQKLVAGVDTSGTSLASSAACQANSGMERYCAVHDLVQLVDNKKVPRTNGSWIMDRLADFYGDGWFDDKDNCPLVANSDQANCNPDTEKKWGFPVRGDACDPTPCARAEFLATRFPPVAIIKISNQFIEQVTSGSITDTFSLTPLGSGPYGNGAALGTVLPPANVGSVLTLYRFCQKNLDVEILCNEGSFNNAFLFTVEGLPNSSRPYHQAHATPPPAAPQEPLTYPSPAVLRTWDYAADCKNWVANGWIDSIPCTSAGLIGGGLAGRFWIDTNTNKGTFNQQIGTGYRVNTNNATQNDDQLHNSYYEIAPDVVATSIQGKPLAYQFFFKWWIYQDIAPAPAQWDGAPKEVSFIVPALGDHAGIVRHDGTVEVLDGSFGAGLKAVFASPLSIVAGAVDASLGMGAFAAGAGPQALVFAPDGTRVVDGVGYDPATGTLGTTADLGIPGGLPLVTPSGPAFVRAFGSYGTGPGQLNFPVGVGVDAEGNTFVVDRTNHRVCKFGPDGAFLLCWGHVGSGDGEFGAFMISDGPYGLEVDKGTGRVCVADTVNSRVQCFDGDGVFLFKFGSEGTAPGQFAAEIGLGIDPVTHDIYVADTFNHRIQVFDSSGTFLRQWGAFGSAPGQLSYPRDVAVDKNGNVYVAEYAGHRISKFDRFGSLLTTWGSFGSAPGQFDHPHGVAVDAAGLVYVVAINNNRVQVFTPQGELIVLWGSTGSAEGQFSGSIGIDVDLQGQIYVSDHFNHRVEVFAPLGPRPAPRTAFVPVFSRVEQRAFVVGGDDPTTGAHSGEVWMLGQAGWSKVPLGTFAPQEVLAATWSFADRRLWILDKAINSPPVVRLTRVEPYLGHVDSVAQWPWTGTWDKQYLVIDARGKVLLASSSTSTNKTALAHFEVAPFIGDAKVSVDSFRTFNGALALPPIADLSGTTLFRFDAKKGVYLVRRRALVAKGEDGDDEDDDDDNGKPKKKDKEEKKGKESAGKAQLLSSLAKVF